jgi:hypothetical protein
MNCQQKTNIFGMKMTGVDQSSNQYSLFAPIYWYQGELDIWRRRERLTPSQWAEKYREVTMGSHQGRWRNDITPYLTKIMGKSG